MAKIHNRVKRRHRLSPNKRHKTLGIKTKTINRPKTFNTETAAHAWAKEKGYVSGSYSLVKAKKDKRFKVVKAGGA